MANALHRAVEKALAHHPRDLIWRSADCPANLRAAPEKIVVDVVEAGLLPFVLQSISGTPL